MDSAAGDGTAAVTERKLPAPGSPGDAPEDPGRRRLLGAMVVAGAAVATGSCGESPVRRSPAIAAPAAGGVDAALRDRIRHVVVIYAENRSFNCLFSDFPGLQQPLAGLDPRHGLQRDRDGSLLERLPPIWDGLVPHKQVVDHRTWQVLEDAITGLPNAPWALRTADGTPLPHGVVTRDLVHAFYRNQHQINGGRNDGFVAWGNSGALVMGHYANNAANLRLWQLARQYTLCDNFFMGAFGGSFLNHQYLVAAQPPFYPDADRSPARKRIVRLRGDDPAGIDPLPASDSPASAMQGTAKFASPTRLTPDFWAVNTMGPAYAPAFSVDPHDPRMADPDDAGTLPPQGHATIGDRLSGAGVDWAWYGGAWQMALDGKGVHGLSEEFPVSPNFQPHHQPLNYFRQFAPGSAARSRHLRDGGTGSTPRTNRLLADIEAGRLPAVAFYKPQGNLNMHAGYSDIEAGDRHIATVVEALRRSPQWQHTLVVVTVDENGGWWDHVAPPKGDRWGPGTRIPALVLSPYARRGHVDHTIYDTGSIQRFLNRRFGLAPLPGIVMRDRAMLAAGGAAPGDLTAALDLG